MTGKRVGGVRRAAAALHRWVGLATAVFLAVAGLTGAAIAFYPELDAWLNPELFRVEARDARPLSPGELARRVEAALPGTRVTLVTIPDRPGWAVRTRVAAIDGAVPGSVWDSDEVYVNPYDGRVLGTRTWGAPRADRAHLMPFIYRLHYSLHLPGDWGVWLLGAVAISWTLDCFVGAYLTVPRAAPRWRKWGVAWRVKPARLGYDVHRAGGLWAWPLLLTLAVSSVYLNLADEVFVPIVRVFSPVAETPQRRLARVARPEPSPWLDYDAALAAASPHLPAAARAYRAAWIAYVPALGAYRVGFDESGRGERAFRVGFHQVFVDANTGRPLAARGWHGATAGERFVALQFPLHSGQLFGLPGRILIAVAGVLVAVLSITGVVIWLRKRRVRVSVPARGRTGGCGPSIRRSTSACSTHSAPSPRKVPISRRPTRST